MEKYKELEDSLENTLQAKLEEIGDLFLPKKQYLMQWGYEVNENRKAIPYTPNVTKVQSPEYRALDSV